MSRSRLLSLIVILYVAALVAAVAQLWPRGPHAASRKSGELAIVRVEGLIHGRTSASPWGAPGAEDIARRLHELSEDDDVKAVLLRINSPGGTVGAVQEIASEVARCRAKGKKVVASLGDVAASGGYYLAASADRIVSDPGTITGSIGVILEFGNLQGLMQKLGVRLEVIKSGAHKDIGSPARALTPEERAMLQDSIDDAYDQFLIAVAAGRHRSVDKIRPLADGRIFTGRQALPLGLVDQLGDEQDAIHEAILLAHLPEHPVILSGEKRSLSGLIERLSSAGPARAWQAVAGAWEDSPSVEYRWR